MWFCISRSGVGNMSRENLRILIVGTPRTGNTWLKFCLSLIYDLPVVEFPTPEFWRSFPVDQYDALGSRWIAHQHFPPFEPVVQWVQDRGVLLITTTRHPADTLVSVYHYVRNFRGRTPIGPETCRLLTTSSKQQKANSELPMSDGPRVKTLMLNRVSRYFLASNQRGLDPKS